MKIEIRETKENGITQITTLGSRWYTKDGPDGTLQFNPSVTWITHYAPMGIGLLKFFAEHGWDEAEEIKTLAGERGTKVHIASERLLLGETIRMDDELDFTPEEYWGVMTFADFWDELNREHKVELIDTERVAWVDAAPGQKYGYAGTRDIKLIVDGRPTILDIKTSKDVYLSHELQLSALKHADPDLPDIAVIQVGYARNKRGWKLTPVEDKFELFQACQKFWLDDNPDTKPRQKDFPSEITLKKVDPNAVIVPVGPDPRIDIYKKEVLAKGEMQPTKELSITAKWNKYVRMQFPLRKKIQEVTPEEWTSLLNTLDGIKSIQGEKGVVLHIEESLKKESQS